MVNLRLNVKYDFCNTPLPPESVYGSHVLNEGNRIEFLLAYICFVLNGSSISLLTLITLWDCNGIVLAEKGV